MNKGLSLDLSKVMPYADFSEIEKMEAMVKCAHETVHEGTGAGNDFLGWLDLPVNYDKAEFDRIKKAAGHITHAICCYFISCSKASNSGVEKNSPSVISKPSHNFLIVTAPGFLLSPFRMLLIVACGTAEVVANPFGVSPFCLHNCRILCAIASRVSI